MSLRRWAPYAAVAALAHAGVFALTGSVRPDPPRGAGEPAPDSTQEVTLEPSPEAPTTPAETVAPSSAGPIAPSREARATATSAGALATREPGASEHEGPLTAPEPLAPAPAGAGSADTGEGTWSFSPTRPLDPTAPSTIAGSVRDIAREGVPAPSPGVPGLAAALADHDVSLGLGRGGPVLAALEAASRGMDVPIEGSATFDVAIDTAGRVSVALSDVSNAYDAWSKVAAAAGATVDTKKVRIPPGARGWRVVVKIDAKVQFPDGTRPKDLGTRFEATPGEISKDSMVVKKMPGFTLSTRGKVCGVGISVQPSLMPIVIGGGCDPENAGMPAVRVVSGHILSEGQL